MLSPSEEKDIVMNTLAKKPTSKRAKPSHKSESRRKRTQTESTFVADEPYSIAKRVKRTRTHIRGKDLSNVAKIVVNAREARLKRKEGRKQRMEAEQVSSIPVVILETVDYDDNTVVLDILVSYASEPIAEIDNVDAPFLSPIKIFHPLAHQHLKQKPHQFFHHHKPLTKEPHHTCSLTITVNFCLTSTTFTLAYTPSVFYLNSSPCPSPAPQPTPASKQQG